MLAQAVSVLLGDRQLRAERAAAARCVAAAGIGILDAVLDQLAPWLEPLAQELELTEPPRSLRA